MADKFDDLDYSNQIDIESIISAPLVAASKANVMMVTGQTRFLLEFCFNRIEIANTDSPPSQDKKYRYEAIMIDMVMTRGVMESSGPDEEPTFRKAELTFSVPLLSIIPLNSLAINKVNVDFVMEITSITSKDSGPNSLSTDPDNKVTQKRAQLNGKISSAAPRGNPNDSSQYKSQASSTLKVNIDAGPLPLPLGVLTIIDLYVKNIQPVPANKKIN